jgi:hypothetical protein
MNTEHQNSIFANIAPKHLAIISFILSWLPCLSCVAIFTLGTRANASSPGGAPPNIFLGWMLIIFPVITSLAAIVAGYISRTRLKAHGELNAKNDFGRAAMILGTLNLVGWLLIIVLAIIGPLMGGGD